MSGHRSNVSLEANPEFDNNRWVQSIKRGKTSSVDNLYDMVLDTSEPRKGNLSLRTVPRQRRIKIMTSEVQDSEYFYLKTRDYITFLRSTLGLSRFHEHCSEDHTLWRASRGPLYTYLYTMGKGYLAKLVHLGMGLAINANYHLDHFKAKGFEPFMSSENNDVVIPEPPAKKLNINNAALNRAEQANLMMTLSESEKSNINESEKSNSSEPKESNTIELEDSSMDTSLPATTHGTRKDKLSHTGNVAQLIEKHSTFANSAAEPAASASQSLAQPKSNELDLANAFLEAYAQTQKSKRSSIYTRFITAETPNIHDPNHKSQISVSESGTLESVPSPDQTLRINSFVNTEKQNESLPLIIGGDEQSTSGTSENYTKPQSDTKNAMSAMSQKTSEPMIVEDDKSGKRKYDELAKNTSQPTSSLQIRDAKVSGVESVSTPPVGAQYETKVLQPSVSEVKPAYDTSESVPSPESFMREMFRDMIDDEPESTAELITDEPNRSTAVKETVGSNEPKDLEEVLPLSNQSQLSVKSKGVMKKGLGYGRGRPMKLPENK